MEGIDSEYPGNWPHPHHAALYILSLHYRSLPHVRDAVEVGKKWRMHSVPQVCIPLFLPLVINTTPQNVAGLGLATQQASAPILLFRLEKGGRGCWGKQTEQLL